MRLKFLLCLESAHHNGLDVAGLMTDSVLQELKKQELLKSIELT